MISYSIYLSLNLRLKVKCRYFTSFHICNTLMYNTRLASLASSLSPLRSERRMQRTTVTLKLKTEVFLILNSWSLLFINELSKLIIFSIHYCLWQLIICSNTYLASLASSDSASLRKDCKKKVYNNFSKD